MELNFFSLSFVFFAGCSFLKCTRTKEINNFMIPNIGLNFFNEYTDLSSEGISECSKQLQILEESIHRKDQWALRFADAWGKIPSGMLYGNQMDMGNFDECLSIDERYEENSFFNGKYCLSTLTVTEIPKENTTNPNTHMSFSLGICIPNVCQALEAQPLLNKFLETFWNKTSFNGTLMLTEEMCTSNNRGPLGALDWIAIGILIMLGALMTLSTCYEYYTLKPNKSLHPLLSAFSMRNNVRQLMHLTPASETPKHIIPALNGIRCLSIIYIIFLHSYMMLILSPNINNAEMDEWKQSLFHMIWKNGSYAVDTFFFLSGMLLISVAFREMEKNCGKLNVPLMYLHRYIRLSPVLYLAVLLYMTLFRFTGNGPIWNSFASAHHLCEDTWWATLTYVQNYAAPGRMCLGHSWYLAVDTQLYFLSPIALILIWRWRRWGLAVLLFVGVLLVSCLFSIILIDKLTVFNIESAPGSDSNEMRKTYYSTHTRVSPWIIGIIFGYYLRVNQGRRVIISKYLVFLGWILSVALFLAVIFSLYPKTQPDVELITPLEGAFYLSLSRIAWPLGVCWVVFACVNGYAGPINDFLSWFIWQPMSKLSYCMYIWHFLIVTINAGQIKTNPHFSNYDAMLRFWSDFGITLIVSTIMYLAIEAPMLGVEKFLLSKKANKSTADKTPPTTISQQNLCD